jgi:hypothetical protein
MAARAAASSSRLIAFAMSASNADGRRPPVPVDEKFPYLLLNAVECMPENEVLILLGGNGARPEAVSWLSREASKINSKRIFVLNVNEFTGWVRREFVRSEV